MPPFNNKGRINKNRRNNIRYIFKWQTAVFGYFHRRSPDRKDGFQMTGFVGWSGGRRQNFRHSESGVFEFWSKMNADLIKMVNSCGVNIPGERKENSLPVSSIFPYFLATWFSVSEKQESPNFVRYSVFDIRY